MAITMRIGLEKDFIPERMSVGELAISTDTGLMRYCHGPNKIKLIATDEDIAEMRKMVSDFDLTVQQALADIGNLGQSQTNRINTAGQTQTQRVNTAGDTQVSRIQAEGTTQVQNVQATAAEISADREQIHTNRDNTARLRRTTAGAITRSAEGSFITATDAADEMGYKRIEIPGMTEQRTTTGAQLFDFEAWKSTRCIRGTAIYGNNSVTVTATEDDAYTNYLGENAVHIPVTSNTTYTLSWEHNGAEGFVWVFLNGINPPTINASSTNGKLIFTTSENTTFIAFRVGVSKAGNSATYSNILLNEGSTALPWEPYTGSKPSPSPEYPQELENVGVLNADGKYEVKVAATRAQCLNWNIAAYENCIEVNQYTVKCNLNEKYHCAITVDYLNDYILSHKGEQMTLSFTGNPDKKYTEIVIYGTFGDGRKVSSAYALGNKVTITIPEDTITVSKLDLRFNVSYGAVSTDTTTVISHIMLNAGSTALPWEPYRGHTATITSDRPLTKWDKLTCRDGVWGWAYRGTKYICSLNEVISQHGASIGKKYPCMTFSMKGKARDAGEVCACNYLKSVGSEVLNGNAIGIWGNTNPTYKNYVYIGIPYSVLGTTIDSTADENTAAMTAWINAKKEAGAPITIEYKLAEEEWVPLTDQEQAAMNALCTYAGTTHIWTDDPLQPVISLDYTVDTETYIKDTTPAYRDVERFALTGEASGTVATCTDSADWPLLGVGMLGKCEQVTTTGKNLFGGKALADKIKEVAPDSTIDTKNGTVTFYAPSIKDKVLYDNFEAGKQYTIILYGKNTNPEAPYTNLRVAYEDGSCYDGSFTAKNAMSYAVYKTDINKTVTSLSGTWGSQYTELHYDKCGIFEGAIDLSSFEPYTGCAPSPSPAYKQEIQETGTYNPETGMYEADMVMTGPQLLEWDDIMAEGCVLVREGAIRSNITGGYFCALATTQFNDYIIAHRGAQITLSCKGNPAGARVSVVIYGTYSDGKSSKEADTAGNNVTCIIPEDILTVNKCELRFNRRGAAYTDTTTVISDIMLNIGDTALPWEPYKEMQSLPLTADQPWRGIGDIHDEVCDRDGVLGTLRRFGAMEYNTAALHSANLLKKTKELRINPPQGALLDSKKKTICDKFRNLKEGTWNKDVAYVYGDAGVNGEYIAFRVDINENPETFFVDNPIKFVYQLAEPYFEPFPEEIQKQYRKLKSCAGTTHAWVDDPLQPEVSFRYVKDSKLILGKLEDRLTALEAGQAQTAAAFSYLPPEIQAEMIETETRELMNSI